MNNNFTAYELMVMVNALEKYASECEKHMKDADMDMEREYYKRRMESANTACIKALKERFEAYLAYVIDLVEAYPDLPESKYILPEFFKEDS